MPASFRLCRMPTVAYASFREPEPAPPRIGLIEAQPNTFSLLPDARGSCLSSFCRRAIPSSPICTARSCADLEVSSVIVPLPVTSESIVLIGPVQIILIVVTIATRAAVQVMLRVSFFFGFCILITAMLIMIARARMTPMAIRCGRMDVNTFMTSSQLIANIVSSSPFPLLLRLIRRHDPEL